MEQLGEVFIEPGLRENSFFFHAIDGHSYHFNKEMKGGRISFRCISYRRRRRRRGCMARASVAPDGTDFRPGRLHRHNHEPMWSLRYERRFRGHLLNECRKAENVTLSLKDIYDDVRRRMIAPPLALIHVPYKRVRSSMDNARRSCLPQVPHSLSELAEILEDPNFRYLTDTLDGHDNIYVGKFGQSAAGTRCLIFASRRMLQYTSRVLSVMSDATFSSVPAALRNNCTQIWNIITLRRHHIIPLVRVFMQTKQETCYLAALRALKAVIPDFSPTSIMCDFEPGQANAWEMEYPQASIGGCFFHSSKAIAGMAKSLGLRPLIVENPAVDSIVRSMCALALLPGDRDTMFDGLACIADRCQNEGVYEELEGMLLYMLRTWYSPGYLRMFSVYGRPDRTTNACESANDTLKSAVRNKYPNMWTCLFGLLDLEDISKFDLDVLDGGRNPSRPQGCEVKYNDEIIQGLQEDLLLGAIDIDTFLRRASRRVQGIYNDVLDI